MAITRGPVIAAVAALARRKELVLVMAELPDAPVTVAPADSSRNLGWRCPGSLSPRS
jgi:hypothetical protein